MESCGVLLDLLHPGLSGGGSCVLVEVPLLYSPCPEFCLNSYLDLLHQAWHIPVVAVISFPTVCTAEFCPVS